MQLDLAALVEELRALRKDLRSTNTLVCAAGGAQRASTVPAVNLCCPLLQVVLAVLLLNVLLSTVYYYAAFKRPYVRLTAIRQPVFDPRTQLPQRPLNALVGTGAATLALTLALHFLAARFDVHSWQEGLTMAAALLVIDSALNAR